MPIQPTLDTEIETLKQSITAEREHTSRAEYISIVQPLKNLLATKIEQNEVIKDANKAFIGAIPPTPEEVEKKYNLNVANEIALKYTLADEVALLWKLQTGELTIDSPEIAEQKQTVADAKLKCSKV